MLEPSTRHLYLDALRPPDGYRFDCAVVTTYSLDLIALLAAPLAFTAFGWRQEADGDEGLGSDPLPALDALRRHIDRIAVFCQKGQIKVPSSYQPLFDYLEGTVHEVALPPGRGVFHPKIWLLRYLGADGGPVRHRLVCLTRNLTFDTQWDTMVVLDGVLAGRRNAFARNHPLGDFIAALPALHGAELPPATLAVVETLQDEVRRVEFEVPPPFREIDFHPLGLTRRASWPFPENKRQRLVMSPFLAAGFLERFASQGTGHVLISRSDELAAVGPEKLAGYGDLYELDQAAEPEVGDPETAEASAQAAEGARLQGLHAKLFLVDDGHQARLWTGSANATSAAFGGNVEFLVELRGSRGKAGVEALLGAQDSRTSLRTLLRRLEPADIAEAPAEDNPAETLAESARLAIAGSELTAKVGPGVAEGTYAVTMQAAAGVSLPAGVSVTVRPLSLAHARATVLGPGGPGEEAARFDEVSYEGLTSFFAFQVAAEADGHRAATSFVLNLPLEGAPEGRLEAVLGKLLARKEDFLRFLLLLLAESGLDVPAWLVGPGSGQAATGPMRGLLGSGQGLLELLLRALARDPDKLRVVSEVVEDLRAGGHGDDFLPDGFDAVWNAIWAARGAEATL